MSVFMKALLLGDKAEFYLDVPLYISMSRAGIMHVVAVSGLHISFLIGFIRLLFGNSKKCSYICLPLIWVFVLLVGAPPSAVRAAIMQSSLLIAPLIRRENDAIRSLLLAFVLIVIFNPTVITSISFQLSFGAMLGIVLFSGGLNRFLVRDGCSGLWRYIGGIIASSLSVMIITVPITAYHFGTVQLLSPLTNILVLWAVTVCFCGGYVSVLFGALIPAVGKVLSSIVSMFTRYIFFCANLISSIPLSNLYCSNSFIIWWVVLTYSIILLSFLAGNQLSTRIKILASSMTSITALSVVLLITPLTYQKLDGIISAVDVGQGQCIVIRSEDSCIMVDCGNNSSFFNAGVLASNYLKGSGCDKVDVLVLSHLHKDHCSGVEALLELTDVEKIVISEMASTDDELLDSIQKAAEKNGTEIVYSFSDLGLKCGTIRMNIYQPMEAGDINEQCLFTLADISGYRLLLTGDAGTTAEKAFLNRFRDDIGTIDLLIAGHHGSKYSTSEELLDAIKCSTSIISCGSNSYGHPTYETLSRLHDKGCRVLRTDLNHNVEIRIS